MYALRGVREYASEVRRSENLNYLIPRPPPPPMPPPMPPPLAIAIVDVAVVIIEFSVAVIVIVEISITTIIAIVGRGLGRRGGGALRFGRHTGPVTSGFSSIVGVSAATRGTRDSRDAPEKASKSPLLALFPLHGIHGIHGMHLSLFPGKHILVTLELSRACDKQSKVNVVNPVYVM